MPNWCDNRVYISCSNEVVMDDFVQTFMPSGYLDFQRVIPVEDPTASNCHEAWGTKWNLTAEDADNFDIGKTDIHAFFETAWAPPDKIYQALYNWFESKLCSFDISWFYDEPGMQFAGYLNNEW